MRTAQMQPSQGALPPNPRDIWGQKMEQVPVHFPSANIPAGGSDAAPSHPATGPGAQNSSFKNFGGPRAHR